MRFEEIGSRLWSFPPWCVDHCNWVTQLQCFGAAGSSMLSFVQEGIGRAASVQGLCCSESDEAMSNEESVEQTRQYARRSKSVSNLNSEFSGH